MTGLAFLLSIVLIPAVVRADEELVLTLPSSNAKAEEPRTQQAPPTRKSNPALLGRSLPSRKATVARKPVPEKVVGKLGVSSRAAAIHSSRSTRSRSLSRINAGTYVALTKDVGDWYGVLMVDRSTGWVRKRDISVLEYEVMGPALPERRRLPDYMGTGGPILAAGGNSILEFAQQFLGVPYKYGGNSTASGIDCSAFVRTCFQTIGINLPRTAAEQYNCGMPVEELQPADRLYFASRSGRISHTGIYLGNGYFIHSSSSRHGVAISRLNEPMYQKMFAGARR